MHETAASMPHHSRCLVPAFPGAFPRHPRGLTIWKMQAEASDVHFRPQRPRRCPLRKAQALFPDDMVHCPLFVTLKMGNE